MIGHYLLTLTEEQEDRVLTQEFAPITPPGSPECWACLCMTASGSRSDKTGVHFIENERGGRTKRGWRSPGWVYEYACTRFGVPRVNAAIRNRILANRVRRILQHAPVSRDTEVDSQSVGECRFGRGE